MSEVEFSTPFREKQILLYLKNNHYDTIKSLPAFFNSRFFCFICLKKYSVFDDHP